MVTTVGVETRMENSQSRIRKRPRSAWDVGPSQSEPEVGVGSSNFRVRVSSEEGNGFETTSLRLFLGVCRDKGNQTGLKRVDGCMLFCRRNGPWWHVMKGLEGVDRLRNETMIGKDIMFTILARISLQDVSFSESLAHICLC